MNEKLYIFKGKAKLRLTQVRNQTQIARMKQKQVVWSEEEEEEEEEEESSVFDTMNGLSDAQLLKTFRR